MSATRMLPHATNADAVAGASASVDADVQRSVPLADIVVFIGRQCQHSTPSQTRRISCRLCLPNGDLGYWHRGGGILCLERIGAPRNRCPVDLSRHECAQRWRPVRS